MRYLQIICILFLLFAAPSLEAVSQEETLFMRRIEAFWKDMEWDPAKDQIVELLKKFPHTEYLEDCYAMLGEIAYNQKDYGNALLYYEKIVSRDYKEKIKVKKWQLYLALSRYDDLLFEIIPSLIEKSDDARFYYAEACFGHSLEPTIDSSKARLLLQESLFHFEMLSDSKPYGKSAKSRLSEIYQYLGQTKEAIDYYLSIAKEFESAPDKKKNEALLFHVAQALSQSNQMQAKEILSHLVRFGEKKKKEGAYLWFYLLVKEGDYDELIANSELFSSTLSFDKKSLFQYVLGKIHLKRKNYIPSLVHLELSVDSGLKDPYLKDALFSLVFAAKEAKNLKTLEKAIVLFNEKFPSSEEFGKVNLLYAQGLSLLNENELALQKLTDLIEQKKALPFAVQEKAKILQKLGKREEALTFLEDAVTQFPKNKELKRIRINLLLESMQQNETAHLATLKTALKEGLKEDGFLESQEIFQIELLLAKCEIELKNFNDALQRLEELVKKESKHPDVHTLLASVYQFTGNREKAFLHGEKAIQLMSNPKTASSMHLQLFNLYLEEALQKKSKELERKASHHLFEASKAYEISTENRVWLARMFTKKILHSFETIEAEKAITVLEPLFRDDNNLAFFEEEVFDLVNLYQFKKQANKEKALLERYLKAPISSQANYEKALLFLGQAFFSLNDKENAKALFHSLNKASQKWVKDLSELFLLRIAILETKGLRNTFSNEIVGRLKELKNLKVFENEPLSIESALDYVDYVTSFEEKERLSKEKALLVKEKEEFSAAYSDFSRKESDQAKLLEAYLRFIEARIYRLEGEIAKSEGKEDIGNLKLKAAKALFSSLRQGNFAVTPYLTAKAEKEMSQR